MCHDRVKNTTQQRNQRNHMDFIDIIIYFAISVVGGAINAVAGGGTFLIFPVLVMHGFSPLSANIACTIAVWPGAISSVYAYRKQLHVEKPLLIRLMGMSALGSLLGAALLLGLPEIAFTHAVPWLMLFATLIFTFGGYLQFTGCNRKIGAPLQFLISIYGGYFGAGQGMLMLAMLRLIGMNDIHRMNALKSLLGASINAIAVLMFVMSGKVVWPAAIVMIAGAVTGGFFGAKLALKIEPRYVRYFVSAVGASMTIYFFTRDA